MKWVRLIAAVSACVSLAACGGGSSATYRFERHVTVDLTGTQALHGTFDDSRVSTDADPCAASVRPAAGNYPGPGTNGDAKVDGQAFELQFLLRPDAPQTTTRVVTVKIGATRFDSTSAATIRLNRDGGGQVVIPGADASGGAGHISGRVAWSCKNIGS